MRLYEVAGLGFIDDLANLLKVMQGRSNTMRTQSVITWPAINNLMRQQGYGDIDQDMLTKIRDQIDPSDSLIQDITNQGIVLNTAGSEEEEPAPEAGGPSAKSVDQMAHNVVKREFG